MMEELYLSPEDELGRLNVWDQHEQEIKDKIHGRLNSRCELDPCTDCWVYTGYWDRKGQGQIRVGRRVYTLPRVSAWLYISGFRLEDPRWAFRRCENSACFNPAHVLVADSQAEALALLRGMGRFGGGHRKLCQEIADRVRFAFPYRHEDISTDEWIRLKAVELSVRPQAVKNIITGKSWKGSNHEKEPP
jgi:hypothetical protein